MPKKRSQSQRVGEVGERYFAYFCEKNGLLPNKLESDYGLDFWCQIDTATALADTGIVPGSGIGFSVRTTIGDRVKLTRPDTEFLLSAEFPTGLAMITTDRNLTECKLFFTLLDAAFVAKLSAFLTSKKDSISFAAENLLPEKDFHETARGALAPGFVERIRIKAAEIVANPVGNVRIEVRRNGDNQTTLVTTLDLFDYFDQARDSTGKALHLATFGAPRFREHRIQNLAIEKRLVSGLVHLPQPWLLVGGVIDQPSRASVGSASAKCSLEVLYTGNKRHFGYVHEAGFALTVSERTLVGDQHVHLLEALVDEESDDQLLDYPDLLAFLELCTPASKIVFEGHRRLVLDAGDFEHLGEHVAFARSFRRARALPGFDDVEVTVQDMASEESRHSIAWWGAVADPETPPGPIGLLLKNVDIADCAADPAIIRLPVACNISRHGVVAWLEGEGEIFTHEGAPCGFRVAAPRVRDFEIGPRLDKKSLLPELSLGPATMICVNGSLTQAPENASYSGELHMTWTSPDS